MANRIIGENMKAVIQRCLNAELRVDGELISKIEKGMVVFLGVGVGDSEVELEKIGKKIVKLRIFEDKNGKMNLSIKETQGEILLVSQFTLYASTVKGNRPSYIKAAKPDIAVPLYEKFVSLVEEQSGNEVKCGIFGADMKVSLLNDGPVTIIVDSKLKY